MRPEAVRAVTLVHDLLGQTTDFFPDEWELMLLHEDQMFHDPLFLRISEDLGLAPLSFMFLRSVIMKS